MFFFFNGLRQVVRKVGDYFGTDSRGESSERMEIVFFEQIARAIRSDDNIF